MKEKVSYSPHENSPQPYSPHPSSTTSPQPSHPAYPQPSPHSHSAQAPSHSPNKHREEGHASKTASRHHLYRARKVGLGPLDRRRQHIQYQRSHAWTRGRKRDSTREPKFLRILNIMLENPCRYFMRIQSTVKHNISTSPSPSPSPFNFSNVLSLQRRIHKTE
jgi:hypothetical protein